MAEVEFKMAQLVNLAIGSPEVGAVNFNLLQRVLLEMLKLSDLESATVMLKTDEAAKLEEIYSIKPTIEEPAPTAERVPSTTGSVRRSRHQCAIDVEKIDLLLEEFNQMKLDLDDLNTKFGNMAAKTETVPVKQLTTSLSHIDDINERVKKLEEQMQQLKDLDLTGNDDRTLGQRLVQLEKHVTIHEDQLEQINNILNDKLNNVLTRFSTMEKDMDIVHEKLNIAESTTNLKTPSRVDTTQMSTIMDQAASINNLVNRLSTVQQDLDKITLQISTVHDEQEQRQMVIDVLTEQIDLLKLVKADKTNVEDVLAAKADLSQVHRKVSHDHFENKMITLTEQLEDAFHRLDAHEELWQEEVDYIKTDIENKLDKSEFSPMKDYINERLKLLQDKMKALSMQNREGVAAGTKKRLIKDVQCISCDNESVMKPEINFEDMTPPPCMPLHQSVKPYLTYELDKVRKQQIRLPGKNMNHLEEMMKKDKDGRDLKQIYMEPQRNPEDMQTADKLLKEGRVEFSKGQTILEHAFKSPNQPLEEVMKQGKEAYVRALQLFARAIRMPGVQPHNVESMMKECREACATGHKLIESSSRSGDKSVASCDDFLKKGQQIFDNCLSVPGFNILNFNGMFEQFAKAYEKSFSSANRTGNISSAERIANPDGRQTVHKGMAEIGISQRNPHLTSASRTGSGGEHFVNRYVGGSHTKTTPHQRVSRAGNFYETWGPIITAVGRPSQSQA